MQVHLEVLRHFTWNFVAGPKSRGGRLRGARLPASAIRRGRRRGARGAAA